MLKTSEKDFRKTVDTSMYGVYYGLRVFMPLLLRQDCPSALVSTSSVAGLTYPTAAIPIEYYIAKHAVVLLMECASGAIRTAGVPVTCHVLCPLMTKSNILKFQKQINPALADTFDKIREQFAAPTEVCISRLEDGIRRKIFYIVSPDRTGDIEDIVSMMRMKANDVLQGASAPCTQTPVFKKEIHGYLKQAKKELQKMGIWEGIWPAKF